MFSYIVVVIFFTPVTNSLPYGKISQAQFITNPYSNIWLYNQSSWSQCMCQIFQNNSSSIVAFNYFYSNQTCQLIQNNNFSLSLPIIYLKSSLNSTAIILQQNLTNQLQLICCADISWVMNQLQQSNTYRTNTVISPVGLTLDTDLNMLVIIYSNSSKSMQQFDLTGNMTGRKTSWTKSNAQPVTYHQGIYYIGINRTNKTNSNYLFAYNQSFSSADDINLPKGNPQRAIWLFNNTLLCAIIQNGLNSTLAFVNWSPPPANLTYNRTVIVPFNKPYGLTKSNDDTMIYITGSSATIYQLSTKTFIWSTLVLNDNSTEIPMSLTIDSCGNRLWVLMLGYGIRIYDRIYGYELASWNMSISYPTLYDMVLTSDYELYLIDYTMNQLIHYGIPLTNKCTINR